MELKLNIYNGKEIEKTYTSDECDLMYGTLEDILEIVDATNEKEAASILKTTGGLVRELRPMLKQIFNELTEEELRRTKVKELISLFSDIFAYAMEQIYGLGENDEKN